MFIYHAVPEKLIGDELVPLNKMSSEMSDIKSANLGKYIGREEVIERKIPLLNCLWNDVVQFLPLHPQKVFRLQNDLGLIPEVPKYKFYEIPVSVLDPSKTVIYFKTAPGEMHTKFVWLHDVDVASLQDIPPATKEYYQSLVGTGELPFNYQFIPHVLYAGSVNVANASIITLY